MTEQEELDVGENIMDTNFNNEEEEDVEAYCIQESKP